ncbi:MAG: hypothetical protein NTX79_00550 [Candidatus Micrarchaeota archaeon]|nr:hypothetical protein [Candidatus Micrarchaeota archaeon]
MNMIQPNQLSRIAIGKGGDLIVAGIAKITQKHPLYDRLATPHYLNEKALASAELFDSRFGADPRYGELFTEKYAVAVEKAALKIWERFPSITPGMGMNSAILDTIRDWFGTGTENLWKNRNLEYLALFDVYSRLGATPTLSLGRNFDLQLEVGGNEYAYDDDKAAYEGKPREKRASAKTPAQACSLVHLILGDEAEGRAKEGDKKYEPRVWKGAMADAIKHYEEAVALDIGSALAIDCLSDAYAKTRQFCKASDLWMRAFEAAQNISTKDAYALVWSDIAIHSNDAKRMIGALRAIEEFCSSSKQCENAGKAAGELRAALADALGS